MIQPASLQVAGASYRYYPIEAAGDTSRLPCALKILLENLLRRLDGARVTEEDVRALADWHPGGTTREIAFMPARVLMQDFTGVPAVVDLAAMRDAVADLGGRPEAIDPQIPAEMVIDHSVQVDHFGTARALADNTAVEFARNRERYAFLKWGQQAFGRLRVVPPGMGIVHQINLEALARVVFVDEQGVAMPDTLVGTDSHTTMINGLGVLGWGVGGIEAEAAMLGQPISMLLPRVVGFELTGALPAGATATDLVLTIVEMLRAHGVVGKFVEFYGEGVARLSLADRATIANMAPEYGATCGLFAIDDETLNYLRLTGRDQQQIALVEAYAKAQGLWRNDVEPPQFDEHLRLDMATITPSIAGPRRPQDRIALSAAKAAFERDLTGVKEAAGIEARPVTLARSNATLRDGAVVIAAITSCTNTSNPSLMLAAGLLAKKAVARGLARAPWVKSSLAPGSRAVAEYLAAAGLIEPLEALGFHIVGYGCTTCIGNSGPLPQEVSQAIAEGDLTVCAILSGNRNFEGRIHPEVRMNYLASPPLVVAYAIAGTMEIDLTCEPLGHDAHGRPVMLDEIWPTAEELAQAAAAVDPAQFARAGSAMERGDDNWRRLDAPQGDRFDWPADSTYIRQPPYFRAMAREPEPIGDLTGLRVLALLGDSVTTDHISPAGAIKADSPAGAWLRAHGVAPRDFNSYGSRRGNHEVMMRGTFANIRLRNLLAPGSEGGVTRLQPEGEEMTIFDAATALKAQGCGAMVIAGREYGTGSSRDWAAKGPALLGVRAVLAESFERIHRSNLVGMGLLPLQFREGENAATLGLTGFERFDIRGIRPGAATVEITATADDGGITRFPAQIRIDTPREWDYYRHGGILPFVLRRLAG
ncbi:MAG: aconitate hydratase AcnA [Zetaproteobacteria bacterium]|nr:MAG: aconitate hydratase AcnA [Zetaproteobacteria bacterium]